MRLTKFIRENHKKIVEEWVEFAATLVPWAKGMSEKELRDHAVELLTAVASDMEAPQSDTEQSKKSKGRSSGGTLAKVGHKHASQRLASGLNLDQLVSEYRALRASVLRLWEAQNGDKRSEVTRFNEAIDESLTEAAMKYSEILGHTREQFLAVLGHDLRNPLSSIIMGATLLTTAENIDDKNARVASRILSSGRRMNRMVSDLLDLTRTRLGSGIPVTLKQMDLTPVCEQVIAELEAVHPDSHIGFEAKGDLRGKWDGDRLTQVVSNLVANALQYGDKSAVKIIAEAHGEEVVLRVNNQGPIVARNALEKIFEPMVRRPSEGSDTNAGGLGLGLYIAREIVLSHGGTVGVTSIKKEGTTFTVCIPRDPSQKNIESSDSRTRPIAQT